MDDCTLGRSFYGILHSKEEGMAAGHTVRNYNGTQWHHKGPSSRRSTGIKLRNMRLSEKSEFQKETVQSTYIQFLYKNVQSSFICKSPKLETPQPPSIGEWLNKLWYIQRV